MLIAAIEGGGTKFSCGVFDENQSLIATHSVPTTTPEETVEACAKFLRQRAGGIPLKALGLACFGPLDLDRSSASFGAITETPKPSWSGFNVADAFRDVLDVKVFLETDVAGSALGEHKFGAAKGIDNFVYATIGTGVGAAVIVGGRLIQGATHFEVGHVGVRRAKDDSFSGVCPFHGDCLSGLACGPAIEARWGVRAPDLPADHPAWDLEAHYISEFCASLIYSYGPRIIILGGGVMDAPGLLGKTRFLVSEKLAGYHRDFLHTSQGDESIGAFLVPPGLGQRSALFGALSLALSPH